MLEQKSEGQVFTPANTVKLILDKCGYNGNTILNKKILENSCGEGAFLLEIVERYICEARKNNWNNKKIKSGIEKNIVGIEKDKRVYKKCIKNLNSLKEKHGLTSIRWSVHNANALSYKKNMGTFDFVVGNPPYIRIHNLDDETRRILKKDYIFCKKGMIDIYLAFFELGLKMLKNSGTLTYITPNMFLKNSSNKDFRLYLTNNKLITDLINFGYYQIFENINTYNCIIKLKKNNNGNYFNYYTGENGVPKLINKINFSDCIDGNLYLVSRNDEKFLKRNKNKQRIGDIATVQYGIATLRDKIFISNTAEKISYSPEFILFNGHKIELKITKQIVKGSRLYKNNKIRKETIIFPYKKVGHRWTVIAEEELRIDFPFTWKYLVKNKNELISRSLDGKTRWYEFGRSQAIQSVHAKKIVIDTLVNGKINSEIFDKDIMVYSGIFVYSSTANLSKIRAEISSDDFFKYARLLGKDMQNGYKCISSSIIRNYCF